MILSTTNDIAILLIATGVRSSVTLPDMTTYLPGEAIDGDDNGIAVYKIQNGYVTVAELMVPVALLKDLQGEISLLGNLITRKKGWFSEDLTAIE